MAQLMAKENGYALVRLPSGEMRNVPVNCTAVIGQVSNICLLYTSSCLVDLLGGNLAEAQLNSLVAIALDGLLLHDSAGTSLDDGDGNDLAVRVEQLGHTDFLADNAFNHFLFLL